MNSKNSIFILADDSLIQEKFSVLKKHFVITCVSEPISAIESIFANIPDLLLIQEALAPKVVRDLVLALKENLRLTHLPIILLLEEKGLNRDWEACPVDDFILPHTSPQEILARLKLALARIKRTVDTNPLTGLPGNTSILKAIEEKIKKGEDVAIGYVDLDQFKPFNDKYGFARGDEILRMIGRVLSNVVLDKCGHKGFVGHIGGDDFVFICPREQIKEVCEEIIKEYEALLPSFLDDEDLRKGYFIAKNREGMEKKIPFPSLSIAVVPILPGRFKHYGEVSAVASQVKKKAKEIPGNSYFIDRRKH